MTAHARGVYKQGASDIRFDWGLEGAGVISSGAGIVVVVDVLSFTTTLSVAMDYGVDVYPYRLRDASAAAFAASKHAILAVGRSEAGASGVSLSPASVRASASGAGPLAKSRRLVLPSPNGSAISKAMAEQGAVVLGASLRNAAAVAAWIDKNRQGQSVAIIASGERWPGDLLRPAIEDMWGAGAVIAELQSFRKITCSPEASAAAAAYLHVKGTLLESLQQCASGRELIEDGHGNEIEVAAEARSSMVVPVLRGEAFTAA
ncbi:2-phosphosulfolactate phosphatase [Nakamurella antarctica]|uniref:Probable 2-phosphosulfolactate phosphatase n=1 Tax=Nakamurella antarctica TaxID=1902245 RepID=A0A3G8ZU46_9ACTN|nr:2-phosphosulfolactate phosphatase [Nakamurella antarctica]AZI57311.1 2-phosphosulfolactate phosphatase [Nakamurella antarctica]